MSAQRTTRVWKDTVRTKVCDYRSCAKRLWLAQHVKTGKYMAFEGEPQILREQPELGTGRIELLIDMSSEHWSRCVGAKQSRTRARRSA